MEMSYIADRGSGVDLYFFYCPLRAELKERMGKHKTQGAFLCSLCDHAFKYRCQMSRLQRQKMKEEENSHEHSGTKKNNSNKKRTSRTTTQEFVCSICNRLQSLSSKN